MNKTRAARQKWIKQNSPAIADVVENFPALATNKGVYAMHGYIPYLIIIIIIKARAS